MIDIPSCARQALEALNRGGYEAYLVGGCVRDALRGVRPHDWDIATNAAPEQVRTACAGYRLIDTGLKHGTVTALIGGQALEITTFRVDGEYSDHRHPDRVSFAPSLRQDLARRDFTINALAYHPNEGLIDFFQGAEDIRRGLIRCVGQAERRFREDGLRILRALRFAAGFGYRVEDETAAALLSNKELLAHISPERIRNELTQLLCGAHAGPVLKEYAPVLAVPLPEILPAVGFLQHNPHHWQDVWEHTITVVENVPPEPVLRWAALLHDVGKPGCFSLDERGVGHFYGHAARGAWLAGEITGRLKFDRHSQDRVMLLVRYHDQWVEPTPKAVRRALSRWGPEVLGQLFRLQQGDAQAHRDNAPRLAKLRRAEELARELVAAGDCFSLAQLAVNGRDLLALGYQGREVGQGLDDLLQAVMEEKVANNKPDLLDYVQRKGSGGLISSERSPEELC